ncbi:hypothetical protein J2808_001573 [Pseudarthrobacter sulfonivorans]|nr:hypothetical protein [Pseudarthrobacter sulfonivorans]
MTTVESRLVSARIPGPFFSWLDRNWCSGQATDQALPPGLNFALGWLGYLGYELKRGRGGSALESPLPDASLIRCSPGPNHAGELLRGLSHDADLQQPPRGRRSVGVLPAAPPGQPGALCKPRPARCGNHPEFFAGAVS